MPTRSIFMAVAMAGALAPVAAIALDDKTAERAMGARQGLMQVISWESGPLFGMAKGEIAYDAEAAAARAANLRAITGHDFLSLFPEGTSKADRPGKTRALPDIWADPAKAGEAFESLRAAVAAVADAADDGPEALSASVAEMGKVCGSCHKAFRADEF